MPSRGPSKYSYMLIGLSSAAVACQAPAPERASTTKRSSDFQLSDQISFRAYDIDGIQGTKFWRELPVSVRKMVRTFGPANHFAANDYVLSLIDWDADAHRALVARVEQLEGQGEPSGLEAARNAEAASVQALLDDPMFRLLFPSRDMFTEAQAAVLESYAGVIDEAEEAGALGRIQKSREERAAYIAAMRAAANPHPAGQKTHNVPLLKTARGTSVPVEGTQHKYKQTMLIFPKEGQTCRGGCSFCFRSYQWYAGGQVPNPETAFIFEFKNLDILLRYLEQHPEVNTLLFTGGDPGVMSAGAWRRYLVNILADARATHIQYIRIGTKQLTYWPWSFHLGKTVGERPIDIFQRLIQGTLCGKKRLESGDDSARDVCVKRGVAVQLMAHFNHPVELSTPVVRDAIRALGEVGVQLRTQSPIVNHINARTGAWEELWRTATKLGVMPYYAFIERDTGFHKYFRVPLHEAYEITRMAMREANGTEATARAPVMSTFAGKVEILGVSQGDVFRGRRYLLRYTQVRRPRGHDPTSDKRLEFLLDNRMVTFFARPTVTVRGQQGGNAYWITDLRPERRQDEPFFLSEDEVPQDGGLPPRETDFGASAPPVRSPETSGGSC